MSMSHQRRRRTQRCGDKCGIQGSSCSTIEYHGTNVIIHAMYSKNELVFFHSNIESGSVRCERYRTKSLNEKGTKEIDFYNACIKKNTNKTMRSETKRIANYRIFLSGSHVYCTLYIQQPFSSEKTRIYNNVQCTILMSGRRLDDIRTNAVWDCSVDDDLDNLHVSKQSIIRQFLAFACEPLIIYIHIDPEQYEIACRLRTYKVLKRSLKRWPNRILVIMKMMCCWFSQYKGSTKKTGPIKK